MKICVYGASSNDIDKKYLDSAFELGKELASRGHSLVFGGGSAGVMGAVARGFKSGNGKVQGVVPKFFEESGYKYIYYEADELIRVDTMSERKDIMERSDAFVIAPGGIGTFDEFFQIYTLKQLGRHNKPIILFNNYNYYEKINQMVDDCVRQKFMSKEGKDLYVSLKTIKEVADYIESYDYKNAPWSRI